MLTEQESYNIEPEMVSVIMANYNTPEEYLRPAIESILSQTYENFELIIIDDGSDNDSLEVIESYNDERIVLIQNEHNIGISKSRNKGLHICKGEYMAVMDSDDICLPRRFEEQVEYLKNNKNVIVCGTFVECIGEWEKRFSSKTISTAIDDPESYRIDLLFGNRPLIAHSSAMLNRKLMLEHHIRYDESYSSSLDYKLWVSCAQVADCAILPKILLKYRVHEKQLSIAKKEIQKKNHNCVIQEQLERLYLPATEDIFRYHFILTFNTQSYDSNIKKWIKKIITANKTYKVYDHSLLKKILWSKWTKITYYGLVNAESFGEKVRILSLLSIQYYPKLIRTALSKWRKKRRGKNTDR